MPEADVVEIPLLLAGWQVSALETAAHDRGLTAAEMVRHVLRDFLSHTDRHRTTCTPSTFGSMSTRIVKRQEMRSRSRRSTKRTPLNPPRGCLDVGTIQVASSGFFRFRSMTVRGVQSLQ